MVSTSIKYKKMRFLTISCLLLLTIITGSVIYYLTGKKSYEMIEYSYGDVLEEKTLKGGSPCEKTNSPLKIAQEDIIDGIIAILTLTNVE